LIHALPNAPFKRVCDNKRLNTVKRSDSYQI
jgi:hypothetical protein